MELLNLLNPLWMKPHVVPKLVTWRKQDWLSFGAEILLPLFKFLWFSIFFWLAKMASTSSISSSSPANVCYSTVQAMSVVMDYQSPNVLAADSDSGSVWDFLCWLYCEWIVNKLCQNTIHVHSINSVSKSNFNLRINHPCLAPFSCL